MDAKTIQENFEKYSFYHIIKLENDLYTPGEQRFVPAQQKVLKALRSIPLEGKRVLDIGCRDGLFCFEAEKLGAKEVIGIDNDLSPAATEFLIPYFKSKVKMFQLNMMDITPEQFGTFDVIIFAGVLYHLRYPFWALKLLKDILNPEGHLIIETGILDAARKHALVYCPTGAESPFEHTSITFFNIKGLRDTLGSLGIQVNSVDCLKQFSGRQTAVRLSRFLPLWLAAMLFKRRAIQRFRSSMKVQRATFVCTFANQQNDHRVKSYWDTTHDYHSKKKKAT